MAHHANKTLCYVFTFQGNNETSDRFFWQDGWPVKYTLWAKGRPGPIDGKGSKCVTLNPLTGKWNDTLCYFSHAFVCKKSLGKHFMFKSSGFISESVLHKKLNNFYSALRVIYLMNESPLLF